MKLIRSSFFPASSRAQLAIIPLHAQKRSLCNSSRPVPRRLPRPAHDSSRACHSSSWTRGSRVPSDLEHSPSCQWLGAGPYASRDHRCEACRVYTAEGIQMSPRELEWEWKMHVYKRQLRKDPYSILFGRSEQRLRGLNDDFLRHVFRHSTRSTRRMPRQQLGPQGEPESSSVMSEAEIVTLMELCAKGMSLAQIQATALPHRPLSALRKACHDQGILFDDSTNEVASVTDEAAPRSAAASYIDAKGNWSFHVNENGRISKASGKLVFDPITMRMVPEEEDYKSPREVVSKHKQYPRKVSVAVDTVPGHLMSLEAASAQPTSAVQKAPRQPWSTGEAPKRDITERGNAATVKQTFEQSYIQARKAQKSISQEFRTSSAPETVNASADLAAAWQQEQAANTSAADSDRSHKTSDTMSKLDETLVKTKTTLEGAWHNDSIHSSTSAELPASGLPHYSGRSLPPRSHEAQMTYLSLLKKDKPLRNMNAHEFNQHKMKLLASWTKDARPAFSSRRKRDLQQLADEVAKQKKAYAGFEGKWHLRDQTGTNRESPKVEKDSAATTLTKERIANNLRDIEKDLEKMEAKALVREVREIYEDYYGVIDAHHQQGEIKSKSLQNDVPSTPRERQPPPRQPGTALKAALAEYEFHLGPRGYRFVMGQDKLEKEVKEKGVTDGLMSPCTDTPSSVAPINVQEKSVHFDSSSTDTASTLSSVYRILAYDPESQKIQTAEAVPTNAAAAADEKPLSFTEALARLHNPAKFVQFLGAKNIQDYDIVAARNDLLILRTVRKLQSQQQEVDVSNVGTRSPRAAFGNPVDGTIVPLGPHNDPNYPPSPATFNYLSPTGFVNLEQRKLLESHPPPVIKASEPMKTALASPSSVVPKDEIPSPPASRSEDTDTPPRRVVRKQEPVFSGGPVTSQSTSVAGDEVKVSKRRRRSSSTTNTASSAPSTASNDNLPPRESPSEPPQPNTFRPTKFGPSSFLHSTRTYSPASSTSLFPDHFAKDDASRPGNNTGRRRGSFRSKLTVAAYIAACCYATGVVIEFLRSGPSSEPPSATPSPPNRTVSTEIWSAGSAAVQAEIAKQEQKEYVRHAWGDDLLSRSPRVAPVVPATPKVLEHDVPASPLLAGFEAEDAAIETAPMEDLTVTQRQEKLGALEGLFAFGAGAAAAVCVLLGGFGGSG